MRNIISSLPGSLSEAALMLTLVFTIVACEKSSTSQTSSGSPMVAAKCLDIQGRVFMSVGSSYNLDTRQVANPPQDASYVWSFDKNIFSGFNLSFEDRITGQVLDIGNNLDTSKIQVENLSFSSPLDGKQIKLKGSLTNKTLIVTPVLKNGSTCQPQNIG